MSSVSDELAALRSKGTVRQHANALKSKSGSLSTPEAEEASLAKLKKDDKVKKAEAEELLRKTTSAGGGLVEEELKKVGDMKKKFEKGRMEAKSILSKGAGSEVVKAEADSEKASGVSPAVSPPKAAAKEKVIDEPKQTDSPKAVDDIPDLSEEEPFDNNNPAEDEEVPDLEEAGEPTDTTAEASQTINRNEKKVRKVMSRLDMRPVPGIVRAVMKTRGGNFFIEQPDVYVSGKSNQTYVIFGEARQQQQPSLASLAQKNAAEQAVESVLRQNVAKETTAEADVLEEDLNEEGLEAKDIELIMAQASVEKSVAIKALRENDGDLVNAIMSLTT